MAIFLSESFVGTAGANLTTLTGWSKHATATGNFLLDGTGEVYPQSFQSPIYVHSASSGGTTPADYDVQGTVHVLTVITNEASRFLARFDPTVLTGYYFGINHNSLYLAKRVNGGSFTTIYTYTFTPTAGTSYLIKAEFRGTSIKVYLDGTLRINSTDADVTAAGKVGVSAISNASAPTTTGYHIADVQATDLASGDTTAPVLSAASGTVTGTTTATLAVTTDEGNGTLYGVATTSATAPSAAQVRAGQDNSGVAAAFAANQTVSATGSQSIAATGLTASTTYTVHFTQRDAAGNDSAVVSSATFTMNAGLVAGSASFVSSGPAGIAVAATAPSGGTGGGPTYQWERNADGGSYADLSGATVLDLSDATATTPEVLYGFRCKQTKGTETVTTNTVTAEVYLGGAISPGASSGPVYFTF